MPEKSWLTSKFSRSCILWINYLLFMLLCWVQYKKLFYWVTEKLYTMSEKLFSVCTVHTAFQVLQHVCVYSYSWVQWYQTWSCVPPRPCTWEPQRSQQWQAVRRNWAREARMSHERGKDISWHNMAVERCTWAEETREGTEAGLGLSCRGALIPAAPWQVTPEAELGLFCVPVSHVPSPQEQMGQARHAGTCLCGK